jgi:penicillin V acylase-like amidase (Ntn superfamily)
MQEGRLYRTFRGLLLSLFAVFMLIPATNACTRAVYLGLEVITVRSMDWQYDPGSNLWAFPRGIQRDGAAGLKSVRWTSKYGSVVASAFEAVTADGMNEQGLVANLLNHADSAYPKTVDGDQCLVMSVSVWAQFMLDNYATVAEAVAAFRQESLCVVSGLLPDGTPAGNVHLSISDATGDSAILEYVGGKLVVYHGREYQVMTNPPNYDQQLALNAYWQEIGGDTMLPGTNRASDRFARASFYINAVPKSLGNAEAVASAFSVIRNVSVPLGFSTPKQPSASSTFWRTAADHKNRRYYFESTRSPNVFWVDMANIDFAKGKPTQKLTLTSGVFFAGNTAGQFQPAAPFKFFAATVK